MARRQPDDSRVAGRAAAPVGLSRVRAWRDRVRRTPGGALLLRAVVLVVGVSFIALGLALIVLPGPLTIPPILLGLYILSLEFAWAERLLDRAKESAREAWEQVRAKPVTSALVTVGGLVAAGGVLWAVARYQVVDRVLQVVGV